MPAFLAELFFPPFLAALLFLALLGAAAADAAPLAGEALAALFLIAFFLEAPLALDLDALTFLAFAGCFAIRTVKYLKIYED